VFPSPEESEASPQVHLFPDHELEDMKMKISEQSLAPKPGWGCFDWVSLNQLCWGEVEAGEL
jgi:hypothetical protein